MKWSDRLFLDACLGASIAPTDRQDFLYYAYLMRLLSAATLWRERLDAGPWRVNEAGELEASR